VREPRRVTVFRCLSASRKVAGWRADEKIAERGNLGTESELSNAWTTRISASLYTFLHRGGDRGSAAAQADAEAEYKGSVSFPSEAPR
jgi:hypothetical protein